MKASKLLALGGLMASGLLVNQAVTAADLGDCGAGGGGLGIWNITALIGNSCSQQDKIFTFNTNTLPGGTVQFVLDVLAGVDTHTLTYTRSGALLGGVLDYNISIAQTAIDNGFYFKNVSLGRTTTNSPNITTTKNVINTANVAENHLLTASAALNPDFFNLEAAWGTDVTSLHIVDTVTINAGNSGGWSSITNTFQEKNNVVPEPASLTLLGLGLAGLAARARRRGA